MVYRHLVFAFALAVPGAAWAQGGQGQPSGQQSSPEMQSQQNQGQQGQSQPGQQYATGVVRGVVTDVDVPSGLITIESGNQSVSLRARPNDIVHLSPGDAVSLNWANFNGILWVAAQGGQQMRQYGEIGRFRGQVTEVDRGAGTITLQNRTFRVHPQQLEQITPGQWVNLSYADVSDQLWAYQIERAGGLQGQSQQGAIPGQQGQQVHQQAQTIQTGTVRGVVTHLDLSSGQITIRQSGDEEGQPVTLQARPDDLMNINAGKAVQLQFANYGGVRWLMPSQRGGQALSSSFGMTGQITGMVDSVDRNQGTLVVQGSQFRIHPQQLENVIPGQWVTVSFADVAGVNWASNIQQQSQQGQGQQPQGQQPQGQQPQGQQPQGQQPQGQQPQGQFCQQGQQQIPQQRQDRQTMPRQQQQGEIEQETLEEGDDPGDEWDY